VSSFAGLKGGLSFGESLLFDLAEDSEVLFMVSSCVGSQTLHRYGLGSFVLFMFLF